MDSNHPDLLDPLSNPALLLSRLFLLTFQHYSAIYNLLFPIGILSGIITQIYRYRRIYNGTERQQTKWVIYGVTIGIGGYLILRAISLTVSDPLGKDLLVSLALNICAVIFMLLIPLSITIAVLRYRLWDINPIINRTLVYGALTGLTMAFYILAVGLFANFFQQRSANLVISFLATGVVAILFEPLRQRLQRGVNRLMYGERDDPTTVLTRLQPAAELIPCARFRFADDRRNRCTDSAAALCGDLRPVRRGRSPCHRFLLGSASSDLISLPLSYQSELIGELILAPRAPGESFSTADIEPASSHRRAGRDRRA